MSGSKILPSISTYIAFIVKSLREASCSQDVVNSTSACLPSVLISFLNVVISNFFLFKIAVTVPWEIPVSKTFIPSLLSLCLTTSGSRDVAKSISSISSPEIAFLTQPPTNLTTLSFPFSFRCENIIWASFIFSKTLVVLYDPNFL